MPADGASLPHSWMHRASRAVTRGLAPLRLRGADRLGRSVDARGAPYIDNRGSLTIGDDFRISSVPVRSHLVTGRRGSIRIGDGVTIAAGVGIASEESGVRIGDRVLIGPFCMIWDTDYHDARQLSAPSTTAAVIIEDGVRLEGNVTVLKGAHIGRDAWVLAGSVVSGNVEAGAVVRGVPARAEAAQKARVGDGAVVPDGVAGRIKRTIAETFRLADLPDASDGPATLKQWDSLGALRLMLAIEEEFAITLDDGALHEARTVQALEALVLRLLQTPAAP